MGDRYGPDVLAATAASRRVRPPEVDAEPGLVVEDREGYCGAVVDVDAATVTLEDRYGRRRVFPLEMGGFLLEGRPVTLVRPARPLPAAGPARTASGSVALRTEARVARAGRILVEGLHDATLVERVWGDDLRVEGVVVEPLHGLDGLVEVVAEFRPGPRRQLGVLVDHLTPGSKESRIAAAVSGPHVLVTGHPYIDIWQAVRPASVRIAAWPAPPRGTDWKTEVCRALGWGTPQDGWRRVLAAVRDYTDLEVPLLRAVEELIDHVTAG